MKTPDTPDPQIRPFAAWLRETNRGRTHDDLSEQMHTLVDKVVQVGKAGTLTLTVKVAPLDADAGQLKVTETVTVKLPQPDPHSSIFWTDEHGNLARNDPNQLSFGDITAVPSVDEHVDGTHPRKEREAK